MGSILSLLPVNAIGLALHPYPNGRRDCGVFLLPVENELTIPNSDKLITGSLRGILYLCVNRLPLADLRIIVDTRIRAARLYRKLEGRLSPRCPTLENQRKSWI
jgi:hypothetical protein